MADYHEIKIVIRLSLLAIKTYEGKILVDFPAIP